MMDERSLNPEIKFGRGILIEASKEWGDYVLITMPEIFKSAEKMLLKKPAYIHFANTMELSEIENALRKIPEAETIVGIGGGMAIDFAKFVGWKRGKEPILVPSAVSVDASVCKSIAVREDFRVRYIGRAIASVILCDFDLIQSAPLRINRAGIGDILSIHSALFDWKLAFERGKAEYNEALAKKAKDLVDELEEMADEIKAGRERGLRWLMEAYVLENSICLRNGNSRPEEGSEHFFAYNVEHKTRRGYIHGELVCLGVLLMSRLQENNVRKVERILEKSGVRYYPKELNLGMNELKQCLLSLRGFSEEEKLPYSIINEKNLEEQTVEKIYYGLS